MTNPATMRIMMRNTPVTFQPIRGQYPVNVITPNFQPIRGQYPGNVITPSSQPIRGQYTVNVITPSSQLIGDQYSSHKIILKFSANQKPLLIDK